MTDLLWMPPSDGEANPNYVRRFDATVQKARSDWVLLDQTAFYAGGGGQPVDHGKLAWGDREADVVDVSRRGVVKHVLDGPTPDDGEEVEGILDWGRRYDVMRAHTAQHLVSAVAHELTGVGTERAQMEPRGATVELAGTLEAADAEEILDQTRNLADDDRPVEVRRMRREAVEEEVPEGRADLSRVPQDRAKLRVVEIGDMDICPCGGTHVGSTSEIPPIRDLAVEDGGAALRVELGEADPPSGERKG